MTLLRDNPDLLKRFRKGDPESLETVYRTYVDVVDIVVRRGVIISSGARVMGPKEHDDRLDLIQETFVRAFSENARLSYDGVREYRPYLLTICRNLVVDWARRQGREIPSDRIQLEWGKAADNSPNVFQDSFAEPIIMKVVGDYIADLPAELAAVHQQRYVKGLSQEQTAQKLGLSRQKVRTLEKKLKKGLRKKLGPKRINKS